MDELPFVVSADAQAWIIEQLRFGKCEPATAGFVPILSLGIGYTKTDPNGRIIEVFTDKQCYVGWQHLDIVSSSEYVSLEVAGQHVYIFQGDLEQLTGKELKLENVEVGYPQPCDKTVTLLRPKDWGLTGDKEVAEGDIGNPP